MGLYLCRRKYTFTLCVCGGVKQLVLSVCLASVQQKKLISRFPGLAKFDNNMKNLRLHVYLTVTKAVLFSACQHLSSSILLIVYSLGWLCLKFSQNSPSTLREGLQSLLSTLVLPFVVENGYFWDFIQAPGLYENKVQAVSLICPRNGLQLVII